MPVKPSYSFFHVKKLLYCLLSGWIMLGLTSCSWFEESSFEPWPVNQPKPTDLESFYDVEANIERLSSLPAQQNIDSLLIITDLLKGHDDEKALDYVQAANGLATLRNKKFSKGVCAYYLALLKGGSSIYGEGIQDAIVDGKIGRKLFRQTKRPDWEIRINRLMGNLFYRLSFSEARYLDSAQSYLDNGLSVLNQHEFKEREAQLLKGEVLHEQLIIAMIADTSRVLDLYQECLVLHQLTGNTPLLVRLQINLGSFYESKKALTQAEELYRKAISFAIESKDNYLLAETYYRMGNLRIKQFRYNQIEENSEKLFEEALHLLHLCLSQQSDNKYLAEAAIGRAYQYKGNKLGAFDLYESAILHYKNSMEYASEDGIIAIMKSNVNTIISLCDYIEAIGYKKTCNELFGNRDNSYLNTIYSQILETRTQNLEAANLRVQKYERQDIETASAQKRRDIWIISGFVLGLAGMIFLILIQQAQKRKLIAQMESLRAQINPHFISNSLNAIESLVNMGKNEAASKYLIHFSRLSRRILNSSRTPFVPLSDELKTLEHFLALEQLRFRDKLQFSVDVQESINRDLVIVPAMILQPYLENAIWHGIKPKTGIGHLLITIRHIGNQLVCTVEDDGIGRKKSEELQAATIMKRKSLGMQITQERLRINNKMKNTAVEIIDLYDESRQASGTRVIVRLPYKTKKD